ncbi:glycosyltransferase family 2 protein [Venturia nashicola]|nr:glycosyltransferase family 2 protein [Venturia nashicola]
MGFEESLSEQAPTGCAVIGVSLFFFLYLVAPSPRSSRKSERRYQTILPDGQTSEPRELPCWMDTWRAKKEMAKQKGLKTNDFIKPDDAEVFLSVVVPAYNEEARLSGMLEEAVDHLQKAYGDAQGPEVESKIPSVSATKKKEKGHVSAVSEESTPRGWEILIVSDGSTDSTVEMALKFARDHQLSQYPIAVPGPWSAENKNSTHIPHGAIRVITLEENRGKGGAVTHGMRHVRGKYAVFADADGASKFEDVEHLIRQCQECEDPDGRAVAIGSRAHLVGSEAVVKSTLQRSKLRNFLMHAFHLLIRLMTPPATSSIRDTQCGFKLFSRNSLPDIIPYMHCEGWIFDIEMLMLTESAGIPMAEVPVGWKEVMGSKLNVIWDSLGMAWGLAVLRGAWGVGIYSRNSF